MTWSLTSITTRVVVLPPALVAVIVYTVALETPMGVPVIMPVCGSRRRPAGSGGWTLYCVARPPLSLRVSAMMGVPSAYATEASR